MPRQQTKTNKQNPLLDTTQSGKHFYLSQCNQSEHTSMSTSLNIAFINNFKYTFDDYMRYINAINSILKLLKCLI